ncbi:MAG: MBL fold metallo-hydrolase [Candidatus Micrarchaeia archaeon]
MVKWLGHASFEVKLSDKTILFDPWFDQKPEEMRRLVPPAITANQVKSADLVFVSHEHFDHCDSGDIDLIVRLTNAHVIAPQSALSRLILPPRNRMQAVSGDSFSYRGLDVKVVEARHPQSSGAVGFVVSGGGRSVYFAGDTYDYYGLSGINVDVALLPIGGTFTMDSIGSIVALKKIKCKYVIPMHYDTFDLIKADVKVWAKQVRRETKAEPVILQVGQTFEF